MNKKQIIKQNTNTLGMHGCAQNHKGITLVALIMTVIIMLILAGVTINIALDGGLFGMTKEAAKQTEIAAQTEKIEAERINILVEQISKGLTSKEFMDRYEEELRNNKNFEGAVITRKDDTTIVITTKEGYVFEITEEGTNYTGDKTGGSGENPEEPKPPELNKSNTNFTYDPSTWTNGEVKVGISTEVTGYTLQYSFDNSKWENYTGEIPMSANGPIYARLKDDKGQGGKALAGNVTNIDKIAPTITINAETPAPAVAGNTVSLRFEDKEGEGSGASGIVKWGWKGTKMSDIKWSAERDPNDEYDDVLLRNQEFTPDTPDTYSIYAQDFAGNITEGDEIIEVEFLEANLKNENKSKNYNTLEAAFDEADGSDTLTLLGSYTDGSAPSLTKIVSLNIGSYTLTKSENAISIASGGILYLGGDGTIKTEEDINLVSVASGGCLRLGFLGGNQIYPELVFAGELSSSTSTSKAVVNCQAGGEVRTMKYCKEAKITAMMSAIDNWGTLELINSLTVSSTDGYAIFNRSRRFGSFACRSTCQSVTLILLPRVLITVIFL